MNKEKLDKIKELKSQGKKAVDISRELNIPYSVAFYHYSEDYQERHKKRSKEYHRKNPIKRDKEKYKAYQREYHKRRYTEDPEFREKLKKLSREYQRKHYKKKN